MLPQPPIREGMPIDFSAWLAQLQFHVTIRSMSGATANRPTVGVEVGVAYYDTTLNKPVFASAINPIVWRDATGAIV